VEKVSILPLFELEKVSILPLFELEKVSILVPEKSENFALTTASAETFAKHLLRLLFPVLY